MLERTFLSPSGDAPITLAIAGRLLAEYRPSDYWATSGQETSPSSSPAAESEEEARQWMIQRMRALAESGWCETPRSASRRECFWFENGRPVRCWAGEVFVCTGYEPGAIEFGRLGDMMLFQGEADYGVFFACQYDWSKRLPVGPQQALEQLFEERVKAGWRPVDHDTLLVREVEAGAPDQGEAEV